MNLTPHTHKHVAQLIDANLDRAREGLRVIEDWCRYGIHNKELVITIKDYRHKLGLHHKNIYKASRSVDTDQGAKLTHKAQEVRTHPLQVVIANCARIQEALRVLEEFARNSDNELSKLASEMRYELYQVEIIILKATEQKYNYQKLLDCHLCLITNSHPNIAGVVSSALNAGVTMVQYRCKEGEDLDKFNEAKRLAELCKKHKSLFIINDRVDIALAVEADGVHLGQKDLEVSVARKLLGDEKLIGVSTHSFTEIQQALKTSCNYIGIGPVFNTQSKPASKPIGVEALAKISQSINIPWFAIGGINASNINELSSNGITRIAVINAIINSEDPSKASSDLLTKLK